MGFDITGILDTAKAVTNTIEQFDPLNMAINAGCDLIGVPDEVKQGIKIAAGAVTGDYLLAADGVAGLAADIAHDHQGDTEYWLPESQRTNLDGYSKQAMDPTDAEYLEALQTMDKNYEDFDRGRFFGLDDDKVTTDSISAWANSPDPDKKKVGEFFTKHPEYLEKLDAKRGKDGSFNHDDIRSEISAVRAGAVNGGASEISQSQGASTTKVPDQDTQHGGVYTPYGQQIVQGASSFSTQLQDILKNPNMSVEDKVAMILEMIMKHAEESELSLTEQLAAASENVGKAQDAAQKGGSGSNQSVANAQTAMSTIQRNLQKVVELQSQMFNLLSTLDSKNNEMAKMAIQNMGRA